jgi:hypothetical protein
MTPVIANSLKTALAGAAVGVALTAPAIAWSENFTFESIDLASGHSLAQARTYIARNVTPGTPMPVALSIVKKAGADCGSPRPSDGVVHCRAETLQHVPGELRDVVWTVRLAPAADGALASAKVSRR